VTRARQVLLALVGLGMAAYAVEGGEYGTMDLLALRKQVRAERVALDRLRHEVDSLQREERALAQDPRVEEKVARELYGMIRPGEILYQVVAKDTTAK
jgi:cell division protein FtsB